MKLRPTITCLLLLLVVLTAKGQITIGGNVYGGGNKGEVKGNTRVTVRAGNIGERPKDADPDEALASPRGKVFGGARMANVGGNAFVHIDGANASSEMVINQVYGGNDIAGKIGANGKTDKELPEALKDNKDDVDKSWDTYVLVSSKMHKIYFTQEEINKAKEGDPAYGKTTTDAKDSTLAADNKNIYIGQLFSGGNGDYYYNDEGGQHEIYRSEADFKANKDPIASNTTGFLKPNLDRTYLNVRGGHIGYAYGGGNNVTVDSVAVIRMDNPSTLFNSIEIDGKEQLYTGRFKDMGINTTMSTLVTNPANRYQVNCFFGGNNKADMAIRPTWHLQSGSIRSLYSGGNHGRMIHENGLLLEIPQTSTLEVLDVFGGCRMADVRPMKWNKTKQEYEDVEWISGNLPPYQFPSNLAARVIIAGGDVTNVYGGNDVRGKVWFGNAVGIQTSIKGDIYGGGNGAYAFTDNESYANSDDYGDYYFSQGEYNDIVAALNALRPDAEQVSIQLRGTEEKKTIVGGSIYVGGNCATLNTIRKNPMIELKIGSHVIAENVYLGNNGAKMVDESILKLYDNDLSDFNSLNLKDASVFASYMQGVSLSLLPKLVVEDAVTGGDRFNYKPYSSYIGSLYYGGNRGSMTYSDSLKINLDLPIYIYNKLVGGCNDANIAKTEYNARYEGGILGNATEQEEGYADDDGNIKDRIVMNLSKIRLKPLRLNSTKDGLEWNTWGDVYKAVPNDTTLTAGNTYYTSAAGAGEFTAVGTEVANGSNYYEKTFDETGLPAEGVAATDRRFKGANIYGGCHNSGHVNGNVVINLNDSLLNRHEVFDAFEGEEVGDNILYDYDSYTITKRNSGVILNEQGMDVLGETLTVYGGGKGKETEIWGSATVNINKGYIFQVFGGSEEGAIGKGTWNETKQEYDYSAYTEADERYGTYVNLNCRPPGVSRADNYSSDIADVEFIYGGGFSGPILGSTHVKLDNGRLFNLFAGSCDADILGHTETYVGLNGFPYLRDHIYGGNDLGGEIKGVKDFSDRVRPETMSKVHPTDVDDGTGKGTADGIKDVLQANTYVEYRQGSMKSIFGGCYGDYDYIDEFKEEDGYGIPLLHGSFVNIRPDNNALNSIEKVFGAGEGMAGIRDGDKMQDRSYVLVDIADEQGDYTKTEVFGGGSNNGLGMLYSKDETYTRGFNLENVSAIIDLVKGNISAAYGGAYNEGITVRTVVNVPTGSTIKLKNIFGGAFGTSPLPPCDVYESNVYYRSPEATVTGAIFGGNNNVRRTLYSKVNIFSPVWANEEKTKLSTVYGAGLGESTWAEYTEVNLEEGAQVDEVYGGGKNGQVLNAQSIQAYMQSYKSPASVDYIPAHSKDTFDPADFPKWSSIWKDAWTIGDYYIPNEEYNNYTANPLTNLTNDNLTRTAEMDDRTGAEKTYKYNTNVLIKQGAKVEGYAYGGGLGVVSLPNSGDVIGTTYIALLGGTVKQDIYAAGTTGNVYNIYGGDFMASANAYIKGGSVRNVYGGGWKGAVGSHTGAISAPFAGDKFAETHVVIGDIDGESFTNGIPCVQRNAYGGGEGGAVYGTTNLTLNNGYIGYEYKDGKYLEKIEDETYVDKTTHEFAHNNNLLKSGCMFGGGYVDNSNVDITNVNLFGGQVRNSVFGGGEVAAVGRGSVNSSTGAVSFYYPGKTNVEMYGGHVHRNVYGGGRGYNNLDKHGSLGTDGYVFGQTEVHVHGGEIGTNAGLADGDGNVFGGGDVGYVYSAYREPNGSIGRGVKSGVRYDNLYQGYYYKHKWENGGTGSKVDLDKDGIDDLDKDGFYIENGDERIFTEDCKVLIEPHTKVTGSSAFFTNIRYYKGEKVPSEDLNWLKDNNQTSILANINSQNKVTSDLIQFTRSYAKGAYVPIAALNTLRNKTADADIWNKLDPSGIIIHNAVFAGGNTAPGSASSFVNATSVFGNATASIHDVYHRDLITLGTGHTGGLYGDGNLTFVDGYRELNITNYGTDYYSIAKEISITDYHNLPDREAAYYELRYTCLKECKDNAGTAYRPGKTEDGFTIKASTITADELLNTFLVYNNKTKKYESVKDGGNDILLWNSTDYVWYPNPVYWKESGVLPVYAGRLMNSIQRADFCGVWGSRMVMQGAQDRVPEDIDFTNYTINRVREVSLNKKVSARTGAGYDEPDTGSDVEHGNYFGIYNIVNYLGALTSDVDFGDDTSGDVRTTDNTDTGTYQATANGKAYGTATFYDWKKEFHLERKRNNGKSHNKVALASGVYLEITTEKSTGTGLYEKDWGPITGVVELDLINVSPGIGGGFVYAKNIHGKRKKTNHVNTTLTTLNDNAVTQWDYTYDATGSGTDYAHDDEDGHDKTQWQSSGNFVHSTQTIIDDCYNISNKYLTGYKAPGGVPAHYWYIKGSVYVYPQEISVATGLPNAYSETVEIPLTISAASHGTLKLLTVRPNLYAFYSSPGVELGQGKKMIINDKEYYKNDPISYWDWYLLSKSERALFVDSTCVTIADCKIGDVSYPKDSVLLQKSVDALRKVAPTKVLEGYGTEPVPYVTLVKYDEEDNPINEDAAFDYVFRSSNNVSHDTGYLLTYEVDNPAIWDTWYTPKSGVPSAKIDTKEYADKVTAEVSEKNNYDDGPTYRLKPDLTSGDGRVLGQQEYKIDDVIPESVYTTYQVIPSSAKPSNQASFEKAYVVTKKSTIDVDVDGNTVQRHLNPGVVVSATDAAKLGSSLADALSSGIVEEAYICTNTVQLSKTEFIFKNTRLKKSELGKYVSDNPTLEDEINANVVPAYYCTADGLYGGKYYKKNHNYRGLEAWSSLPEDDRKYFTFNYDALDLLVDPTYGNVEGKKYQYDGKDYDSESDVENPSTGNKAGYSIIQSVDYTASYYGTSPLAVSEAITVKRSGSDVSTTSVQKDDELSREDFEALPNEQRHYAPIAVPDNGKYYVVNTPFQIGSTPYAVGTTISGSTYDGLPDTEKTYIDTLTFTGITTPTHYYYCRESYKMGASVTPITASEITGVKGGISGGSVLLGTMISSSDYSTLPNDQREFTIHGISPMETTKFFVARESDINNLSQDKIITVIYQYDYEETDASGNVTPVSERHVLNITLKFKSGVPIIDDIRKPDIILPGDLVSLREPDVIYDASDLMGGGWELFETERDAESHTNKVETEPIRDPLYWYQHDWYLAYFVRTSLGKFYSNHVQVSVANYHDLKEVMDDTDHHYYIDVPNVLREPKIYINDYSAAGENGLDLFKNLYDLSLVNSTEGGYTVADGKITGATGSANSALKGHTLLNSHVKDGKKLEFFMHTDLDHSSSSWTPIASWTPDGKSACFEGTLHGDGHTITGLDNSLFARLCGSIYNLGVTGSFTGAGIVDEGDGYVENCWINTTGTPDGSVYAVFGNPTDATPSTKQMVNCYYQTGKNYKTTPTGHGMATAKSDTAFYNGEVAYDLNGFYLYKRYNDHAKPAGTTTYKYWLTGNDTPQDGSYASNDSLCSSGYKPGPAPVDYVVPMYVEERFADGDFIYAGDSIPNYDNERLYAYKDGEKDVRDYYPIWPDDYLFFGQKLTYGHVDGQSHQNTPSSIIRDDGRVLTDISGNRVYRAPAYYRNANMNMAHFNPYAVFAQSNAKVRPEYLDTVAYRNMTAIDFTGSNGDVAGGYKLGLQGVKFYPPLLDDDGLIGFRNVDLTQNLLAYTAASGTNTTAAEKTATVVGTYLQEPVYTETDDTYRTIDQQSTIGIRGHWVENGIATRDHLLVDKQDFNAPISYSLDSGKRMWYQRYPDDKEYVDYAGNGWQAISLPFSAELVTTEDKGEITHFYSGSAESQNGTHTKIGHEYWLREFTGIAPDAVDPAIYTANFTYPESTGSEANKEVKNTFLWDYYYNADAEGKHRHKDRNDDDYQTYYKTARNYSSYAQLSHGTPYLLGLPGVTYYEFDLSGQFEAKTTAESNPLKLDKQWITFASNPGETIRVSDSEMGGKSIVSSSFNYTFKPSYLNEEIDGSTMSGYTLDTDGKRFEKVAADKTATVSAFRPYFLSAPASARPHTRSAADFIDFTNTEDNFGEVHEDDNLGDGSLSITSRLRYIVVSSTLKHPAEVSIFSTSGVRLNQFTIYPGQTVETRVNLPGFYIVNKTKIAVR